MVAKKEIVPQQKISIASYLNKESKSAERYEFYNGKVYAMAGGTKKHSLITANIVIELGNALRKNNKECDVFSSDFKVAINSKNSYLYPDCLIICKDNIVDEKVKDSTTNPVLIVEVLSDSTSDFDRGEKFSMYRTLDSLKYYILISQHEAAVEIFTKQNDLWDIERVAGLDKNFTLNDLNIKINLHDLYYHVDFDKKTKAS